MSKTWSVILSFGSLAILLVSSNSALARQTPASQSIESLYKAGRFSDALNSCQRLLQSSPNDLSLRYWRANILVNLHNLAGAKLDYQFVCENSKDQKVKGYCQQALYSLAAADHTAIAALSPPRVAPAGSPSLEHIARQADADSNGILMNGTARQNYFHNKGELEAASASDPRILDAMQNALIRVGNTYVPRYTPAEIQFQRNQLTDTANQLRTENEMRGAEALQLAQQKALETKAAAANLAAQINSGSKSGFHLKEEGTNFYVRQYDAPSGRSFSSSSLPHPATVTVSESADSQLGEFESPLQATARALDPALQKKLDLESSKTVKSNVYGRLNRPRQNSEQD